MKKVLTSMSDMRYLGRALMAAREARYDIDEQDAETFVDVLSTDPDHMLNRGDPAPLDFGNDASTSAGTYYRRNERRWEREERRAAREHAMPTTLADELGIRPRCAACGRR
jgi:hypothetical protein